MRFQIAMLGLCLAGATPAMAAASAPQALSISVDADHIVATQLPAYDPNAPITVSVRAAAEARLTAVRLDADGPAGETLHVPLTRAPEGRFTGSLRFAQTGDWHVRLATRVAALNITTVPVTVVVAPPPPSNAGWIGFAVGAGIFAGFGGGGFWLLQRRPDQAPSIELDRAA